MRRALAILLTILSPACKEPAPQHVGFEGKITYLSKLKVSDSVRAIQHGAEFMTQGTSRVYFKAGSMLKYNPESLVEMEYFDRNGNLSYNKLQGSDSIYIMDVSRPFHGALGPIISFSIQPDAAKILGYSCSKLTLNYDSAKAEVWYSPEIPANPALFKNAKLNNWDIVFEKTRAYDLAVRFTIPGVLQSTAIATRISFEKVPDSVFPNMKGKAKRKLY